MKKLSVLFVLLFMAKIGLCQLSVQPSGSNNDNYIYVNGNVLFVSGGINLQKNIHNPQTEASIYLREEAQLIQGNSATANTGNGLLSVFQEGTSNAFDYNYWASPVGNNLAGNGLFGIQLIHSPENQTKSTKAKTSNNLNGSANPLTISTQWIHTYSGQVYSDWNHIGNKTEIPAGYGFTMKGVNGTDPIMVDNRKNNPGNSQRYDFRGKPNTGVISIPVTTGTNVLVGNPYPSALDLSLFLLENSGSGNMPSPCFGSISRENNITGIAYFWDSKENGNSHYLQDYVGGYGAFSPVDPCTTGVYERPIFRTYDKEGTNPNLTGKHYDRRYAPIAQGFMVEGAANTTLKFKNSHRTFKKEGENSDFKQAERKGGKNSNRKKNELVVLPKIRFEIVVNNEYTRHLSLGFWPTASTGTDIAMDAKSFDLAPTDVGWLQKEESFIIDVRPYAELDEIPLFLKVEGERATLKFSITEMENFETEEIYIFDTKNENYFPITENDFQITLYPGIYHNRFKITYLKESEEITPEDFLTETISFFQNNKLGQLQIINPALLSISSISIYDLTGKQVFQQNMYEKSELLNIKTKSLSNSIYIVKVLQKDGNKIIHKISISNQH